MSSLQSLRSSVQSWMSRRPMLAATLIGCVGLVFAYTAVFMLTVGGDLLRHMRAALMNCVPLALMGYAMMALIRARIIGLAPSWQALFHILAAPAFGLAWYTSVIILLGLAQGSLAQGFSVLPFTGAAFTWQTFQGMTLYMLVAVAAYAFEYRTRWRDLSEQAKDVVQTVSAAMSASDTLILKQGDELRPVDIEDIVLVSGAGDYAEVLTAAGTHLSRKTLGEFEALLPPARFVRIHRSRIVNIDAVQAAEPAGGGRLTLQMRGGHAISTSRAGARLIKERSI